MCILILVEHMKCILLLYCLAMDGRANRWRWMCSACTNIKCFFFLNASPSLASESWIYWFRLFIYFGARPIQNKCAAQACSRSSIYFFSLSPHVNINIYISINFVPSGKALADVAVVALIRCTICSVCPGFFRRTVIRPLKSCDHQIHFSCILLVLRPLRSRVHQLIHSELISRPIPTEWFHCFSFLCFVFVSAMQKLQSELKVQIKIASQATPSPRAKATMETLDRTKADLIINYDSVVQSLKQLNRLSRERNENANNNGDRNAADVDNGNGENASKKLVDAEVQRSVDQNGSQKKGECTKTRSILRPRRCWSQVERRGMGRGGVRDKHVNCDL